MILMAFVNLIPEILLALTLHPQNRRIPEQSQKKLALNCFPVPK